jgi:hypothetical protein
MAVEFKPFRSLIGYAGEKQNFVTRMTNKYGDEHLYLYSTNNLHNTPPRLVREKHYSKPYCESEYCPIERKMFATPIDNPTGEEARQAIYHYESKITRDPYELQKFKVEKPLNGHPSPLVPSRRVEIVNGNIKLDLLVKNGEVIGIGPKGYKIGNLAEYPELMQNLTKKWLKKLNEVLPKIK